jgi:hypothetical protein
MVCDAVEGGASAVVFVNFSATLDELAARLSAHRPGIIRGGQGRSESDITSGGEVLATIGVVVAVLMLARLVWWLCGGGA